MRGYGGLSGGGRVEGEFGRVDDVEEEEEEGGEGESEGGGEG